MSPAPRATAPLAHALAALLVALLPGAAGAQEPVPVAFVVNDALTKDKVHEGVKITVRAGATGDAPAAEGQTDAAGRLEVRLAPGAYRVTYEKLGYVPIPDSPLEVREAGQLVTTTLTLDLESAAPAGAPVRRTVLVILNWGSDRARHVRDLDSHLAHPTAGHVYFARRQLALTPTAAAHDSSAPAPEANLDVDDTDWGGPETITLHDPPPGRYQYWVHDFSEGPGTIATSDVVVRVVAGAAVLGEFRPPPTATGRDWRPFAWLELDEHGGPSLVPFTPEELAAGADRTHDPTVEDVLDRSDDPDGEVVACLVCSLATALLLVLGAGVAAYRAGRRAG